MSRTDAKGQTINFSYDELNRVTEKRYEEVVNATFVYGTDPAFYENGMLKSVNYPGGSESYSYDTRGRVESVTKSLDGISKGVSFTCDSLDRVVTETYPDGEVVSYDDGGMPDSVIGFKEYIIR